MAFSVVRPWERAVRNSPLFRTAKLLAFGLGTYMDGDGLAFPSRRTLAEACSISDRAVDHALSELEQEGFLHVERDRRGGRSRVNRYLARVPETASPVLQAEFESAKRRRLNGPGRENGKQQTANGGPQTAKGLRPKLSNSHNGGAAAAAPETLDHCVGCDSEHLLSVLDQGNSFCPECVEVRS
jgi:DNA-binding transcriptional ArsR family regulator